MSHSSDDYGDGEHIPEGVPLPRQAPMHSAADDLSEWATDTTRAPADADDARDWATDATATDATATDWATDATATDATATDATAANERVPYASSADSGDTSDWAAATLRYSAPQSTRTTGEQPVYRAPSDSEAEPAEPAGSDYREAAYSQPGYAQPDHREAAYVQPDHREAAYAQPGYAQPGYREAGHPQPGYPPPAYPQPAADAQQAHYPAEPAHYPVEPAHHPAEPAYYPVEPGHYPTPQTAPDGYPRSAGPHSEQPADQYAQGPQPYPSGQLPGYATTQPVAPPHLTPAPHPAAQPDPPAPPQPAVVPRPEDLLVPNQSSVVAEPATWGWRGRMGRATGGLVKPKAGPGELRARQAIHDIQRSFSRPMTVVVVQPKGGAGKTPTTICLSAAFGAHRGGYVVGWDDNETRGTLAVRVANPDDQGATVWDLLSDLAAFERFDARVGDLSYYVRSQPDAHFDALVSDDNPGNMSQIGEDEFQRLHKVLQRFYRMIVVDTGNNVRSPNWQAAVNAADLVVVVSSYQRDAGYSGSWVLDHLAQTGREELARNAVTVLTAADPTTDKQVREQLLSHFRARTRSVIEIPYDQGLAHGGPIRWTDLAAPTRNAWILAGATIANCLAEHDQRAMAARRA